MGIKVGWMLRVMLSGHFMENHLYVRGDAVDFFIIYAFIKTDNHLVFLMILLKSISFFDRNYEYVKL